MSNLLDEVGKSIEAQAKRATDEQLRRLDHRVAEAINEVFNGVNRPEDWSLLEPYIKGIAKQAEPMLLERNREWLMRLAVSNILAPDKRQPFFGNCPL